MGSTCIVFIPREDDYVQKISSEKVPHMTMLYLGDKELSNFENVVEYVKHVSETSLYRFGMTVDRRGKLGPLDADVLFFKKGWHNEDLIAARSYLLANKNISEAYNSAEQWDGWTPHLTLGYPESPAKKDDRDYPITYVEFDRIAVWDEDYVGPEFLLKTDSGSEALDIYMSEKEEDALTHADVTVGDVVDTFSSEQRDLLDILVAAKDDQEFSDEEADALYAIYDSLNENQIAALQFLMATASESIEHGLFDYNDDHLAHFGVRGMKWGVSRNPLTVGSSRGYSKAEKAEAKGVIKTQRALVKTKSNSLEGAHIAALKTTGHRATNFFLGDKQYWKTSLKIAGGTVLAVGLVFAAPHVLPIATVKAMGGTALVTSKGLITTSISAQTASGAAGIANAGRAVFGNKRIKDSLNSLGDDLYKRQTEASKKTAKMLSKNGSIPRKKFKQKGVNELLAQSAISNGASGVMDVLLSLSDDEIAHFGVRGMKWGRRRSVGSDGLVDGGSSSGFKRGDKDNPPSSADNDRSIKTVNKLSKHGTASLSDREMRELANRLESAKKLNNIMNGDTKSDLQRTVETLRLEKEKRNLLAEQENANKSGRRKVTEAAVGLLANAAKSQASSMLEEYGGEMRKEAMKSFKDAMGDSRKKQDAQKQKSQEKSDKRKKQFDDLVKTSEERFAKRQKDKNSNAPVYDITTLRR